MTFLKIYVFGSSVNEETYNDIDVEVVSSSFGDDPHRDLLRLLNITDGKTGEIEPHPIDARDISWSPFYKHVKETGLRVA